MTVRKTIRFLAGSFAATLAALLALVLTMPAYVLAASGTGDSSVAETMFASMALIPFVLIVGVPIALPVALIGGGAMILVQRWFDNIFRLPVWIVCGVAIGSAASLFFGVNDPIWPVRVVSGLWFSCGGAAGAIAFQRLIR